MVSEKRVNVLSQLIFFNAFNPSVAQNGQTLDKLPKMI